MLLQGMDWNKLLENDGPFVPDLENAEDTDYFKNGRQDQLAACMSLLGAIKGEGDGGGRSGGFGAPPSFVCAASDDTDRPSV